MTYTFQPRGVCSRAMSVEVDDQGVIRDLQVVGGCNGNLQGISALVKGMKAEEARMKLTAARIASSWFFRFINYVTFPVFVHSAMQNRAHHMSLYYTHIGEKYLYRIPGTTLTAAVSSCFPIRSAAYGQRIPQTKCA